jgi:hypothetical protein
MLDQVRTRVVTFASRICSALSAWLSWACTPIVLPQNVNS